MSLRYDDDRPPLTTAQQAKAIRLAARLQAEHEARASNEAMLRAAEEAGIERRFLDEAVGRIAGSDQEFEPGRNAPRPLVAILILTVVNWLALLGQSAANVGIVLGGVQIALLVVTPLLLASWVGRESRVRWTVPAAVVAVWLALSLPDWAYHLTLEGRAPSFLATLVAIVGGLQLVAALAGSFLGGYRPVRRAPDRPQSPLA